MLISAFGLKNITPLKEERIFQNEKEIKIRLRHIITGKALKSTMKIGI